MLSLTSLIDVVFLLLIFFLVATKFAEEDNLKQMPVELPSASEAKPLTVRPKTLTITISAAGQMYVENKEVTLAELDNHLAQSAANNPLNQTAKVQADKRAHWETVLTVLNACAKHGIKPEPGVENKGN